MSRAPFYFLAMWKLRVALGIKKAPANAEDVRNAGSVPGLGRSPEGEHGNPLQYSCLENLMDRGAWWATVHGFTKSRTQLKQLSTKENPFPCLFQLWVAADIPWFMVPFFCLWRQQCYISFKVLQVSTHSSVTTSLSECPLLLKTLVIILNT